MSKILKNTTGSPIVVTDTGITIAASPASYTIPPIDYPLWAGSSNAVTFIGSGSLLVNDGSNDLSISDGTDLVKGIFPNPLNIQGQFDDVSTGTPAENGYAVPRITQQRGFHVNLRNVAGTEVGTSGAPLRIDPTGTTTQPVSAVALPLPAGASTSALQTSGNASLTSIDGKLNSLGQKAMAASVPVVIASDQSTVPVAVVSSSLPSGAATEVTLAKLPLAQASTTSGQFGVLSQAAVSTAAPSYTNAQTSPLSLTLAGALRVDGSAVTQPISVASLPLPAGASTSALQTAGNATLSSIDAGIPAALGQTTMAASMAVVIASDQSSIPVKNQDGAGNNLASSTSAPTGAEQALIVRNIPYGTQAVSMTDVAPANGSITALDTGTSNLTGSNGQVFYFGSPTTNSAAVFALSSQETIAIQANILGGGGTLVVEVSLDGGSFYFRPNVFQPSTQNYTNGFTAPFSALANVSGMTHIRVRAITSWTGTATIIVRESVNSRVFTLGDSLPQGNNNIGDVDVASSALPTGASTETTLASRLADATFTGRINTLGQKTMAASTPVVLSSDQAAIPVTVSGVATAANQATEITSLQLIDNAVGSVSAGTAALASFLIGGVFNTALPTLTNGQQASAQFDSSARLIIAPLVNTSIVKAQLQDNAGAAITVGQKTMANSVPVVFPSDQTLTVTSSPLPATGSGFAFGDVATSATAQAKVERTTYTEQTTNAQRSVNSSSANDTAAGTGARTIVITYYDQTMAGPFTETVTLNGVTNVNTVSTTICYIEKIQVATVGSTGSNVGTITLKAATAGGGVTIGTIGATDNQTFWVHHYIATGKICYISGFTISNNQTTAGNGGVFLLGKATPTIANTPTAMQVSDFHTLAGNNPGSSSRAYISPIQVAGPARVTAYVLPLAGTAMTMRASFDYIDN